MAATDKKLGELHEAVASHLIAAVQSEEGVPAAVLAVAVGFLKNNNITADPTTNAALSELGQKLAARRQRKLTPAQLTEAAEAFAQSQGDFVQ